MSVDLSNNNERFRVIIKALDLSKNIRDQLNNVDQINSSLDDGHFIHLISTATEISTDLKESPLRGRKYQEIYENAPELEKIFNIPTCLNDCINDNDKFELAINIIEKINEIYVAHGHQIPIIKRIYKETELKRNILVNRLSTKLENLKESPKSDVISLVDYLRRCGNFNDRELKLKYIQARDNWFINCCREQNNSFDKLVAVQSTGLPKIFDEFKSIFCAENDILGGNAEDGTIINSWLLLKTSVFISSLETYLKNVHQTRTLTPTMIADTMKKCFELTNSLVSMGFDFSSSLRPMFLRALSQEIRYSIERATAKFELSFTASVSKSIESLLLPVDDEILRISNMRPEELLPKSIEHYPIFKVYCLNLVDSLRWLQTTKSILSPMSLRLETYSALNASLTRAMKALAVILNTDNNSNHPILSKIAISFMTEILPFITSYCELIFPEKLLLNAIGLTKAEFKQMSNDEPEKFRNFRLDLRQIAEPLRKSMPILMQTLEN